MEVASETSKSSSSDASLSLEQFYINTADKQQPQYAAGHAMAIRKAIIVDKRTRYEIEREHYDAEGEVLMRELTLRGLVLPLLLFLSCASIYIIANVL